MTAARAAAVALLLVAGTAACNQGDGRTLRPPPPGATAPPLPSSSTTAAAVIGPPVGSSDTIALALGSAAFADGSPIPDVYGCEGGNVSPPLEWSGVAPQAAELAIVVTDPDAGGFIHWVVAGISPAVTGVAEGALPEGAVEARNDTSEFGWFGPCPPAGDAAHRYVFTLYALDADTGVEIGAGGAEAIAAITRVRGSAATITGTFAVS